MPHFRVGLCGRNLVLEIDGQQELLGFHTTRFVEAGSADEAATNALTLIQQHPAVAAQLEGEHRRGFAVLIEAVEPLESNEPIPPQQPGLAFFPEEGQSPLA
jgi:hypothetical protein